MFYKKTISLCIPFSYFISLPASKLSGTLLLFSPRRQSAPDSSLAGYSFPFLAGQMGEFG